MTDGAFVVGGVLLGLGALGTLFAWAERRERRAEAEWAARQAQSCRETSAFFAEWRRKEDEARTALRAELDLANKTWPQIRALCEAESGDGAPCECATRGEVFKRIERLRKNRTRAAVAMPEGPVVPSEPTKVFE